MKDRAGKEVGFDVGVIVVAVDSMRELAADVTASSGGVLVLFAGAGGMAAAPVPPPRANVDMEEAADLSFLLPAVPPSLVEEAVVPRRLMTILVQSVLLAGILSLTRLGENGDDGIS